MKIYIHGLKKIAAILIYQNLAYMKSKIVQKIMGKLKHEANGLIIRSVLALI